jgi:calcium/calmodulin-dependent protein kinase I
LNEEDTAALLDEVEILFSLKTAPHIIRLYDFFEEPKEYCLVMETMAGGELFDRIVKKSFYNESEARGVCKILLEAISYCHDSRVVSTIVLYYD